MAEIDALSVSRGTNRGEAAFLGESGFDATELAYRLGQQQKLDRRARKAEEAEGMALLNDKIKTQWDSDTYNYFEPKVKQLRASIMDAMKDQRGVLTPVQKMQFKGAWDELRTEAEVNNKLFQAYEGQVKQLEQDPQGEKWDRGVSMQKLQMFRDPYSVPALKADIQKNYGGDINKWRTANYAKFGLEPTFSFEKYIGDVTKDEKQQEYIVKDEKGNIVYGKHPTGERYTTVGKKFAPEQVQSITNRVWGESNYKSDRAKQSAKTYVDDIFSVSENGMVSFPSGLTESEKNIAKKAIQYAGDMRGMNEGEIKNKLAKGYLSAVIDIKGDLGQEIKDIGFAPQPTKSGGGGSFTDKYTVTTTPYTTGGGVKEFNIKYGAEAPESAQRLATHQNAKIVAIEPNAKGADTESFQLSFNGKQVRPVHYIVDENGTISGVFSETIKTTDEMGQPKYESVVKEYPLKERELANIAAQYGFGGSNGIERFKKDALGIGGGAKPTAGKSIKVSDIAAKAQAAGYTPAEYRKLLQQKGIKIIE